MNASGVSLFARLLQAREGMNCGCDEVPDNATLCPLVFASKILHSAEWQYTKIDWEAAGILHQLEKFHHCCFAKDVYAVTDHKPLLTVGNKDGATLPK